MDPVTTSAIVAALVTGAATGVATGVTDTVTRKVIDAYDALKATLKEKFGTDSQVVEALEQLETKPEAKSHQAAIEEELQVVQADQDPEVVAAAQALLEALEQSPAGKQAISKFNIDAKNAQIGVIGDHAKVEGDITFGDSEA